MGVIYILTNPSFPDYVKIGYATNIESRLRQLNRSEAVPFAFRVYAVYEVNSSLTDKELHRLIDMLNPGLRTIDNFDGRERVKEFYALSPEDAYSLLECIAKISGTEAMLKRLTVMKCWMRRLRRRCAVIGKEGRFGSVFVIFLSAVRCS